LADLCIEQLHGTLFLIDFLAAILLVAFRAQPN